MREAHWPFDQPPDAACITRREILEGKPPLVVTHHDDDHSWTFLDHDPLARGDAMVVAMASVADRHPDLARLADLPPGWRASRRAAGEPWVRQPVTADPTGRTEVPQVRSASRPWNRLMRLVLALIACAAILAATAVVGALIPGPVRSRAEEGAVIVGLVQGPIHTDLVLPVTPALRAALPYLDLPPDARTVLVGWGARGVYTTLGDWGDVRLGTILRAVTGDSAVMRFQPMNFDWQPPAEITLSTAGHAAVIATIASQTRGDQPVARDLFAPGDRFFAAEGRFTAVNTCNQWLARTLRAAGHRFGFWTPTTWSVRLSLWRFG